MDVQYRDDMSHEYYELPNCESKKGCLILARVHEQTRNAACTYSTNEGFHVALQDTYVRSVKPTYRYYCYSTYVQAEQYAHATRQRERLPVFISFARLCLIFVSKVQQLITYQ